jgi:hypothetical protein
VHRAAGREPRYAGPRGDQAGEWTRHEARGS